MEKSNRLRQKFLAVLPVAIMALSSCTDQGRSPLDIGGIGQLQTENAQLLNDIKKEAGNTIATGTRVLATQESRLATLRAEATDCAHRRRESVIGDLSEKKELQATAASMLDLLEKGDEYYPTISTFATDFASDIDRLNGLLTGTLAPSPTGTPTPVPVR